MLDPLLLPLAQASAACYAPGVVFSWENPSKTVHLLHSQVTGIDTFAFTGTESWEEWLIDFLAVQVPVSNDPQMGDVHLGFLSDAHEAVIGYIWPWLVRMNFPPFYLTGHSKGAGEAPLAAGLMKALGHPPLAVRLFEPPKVGGTDLDSYLTDLDVMWTQTFNAEGSDIVTLVPPGPTWWHNGQLLRLQVPDTDDIATKHRIPAVLTALAALP